jgi:hypothetical protein
MPYNSINEHAKLIFQRSLISFNYITKKDTVKKGRITIKLEKYRRSVH